MNGNQSVASRDRVILANSHVRLEFEPEYRGLAAMVDLETHLDHISPGRLTSSLVPKSPGSNQ